MTGSTLLLQKGSLAREWRTEDLFPFAFSLYFLNEAHKSSHGITFPSSLPLLERALGIQASPL